MIDEVHTLIGAGAAEGAIDAANILKPALARGELQCIGATTLDEYRKHIEKDPALERCVPLGAGQGAVDASGHSFVAACTRASYLLLCVSVAAASSPSRCRSPRSRRPLRFCRCATAWLALPAARVTRGFVASSS
jgi:hypothetical protein